MAISLSTNYAGIASKNLISAAINSAPTIAGNSVTVMPNIKSKMNIRKADWSNDLIQADNCDYNSVATLSLSEAILDPTSLMSNSTVCKLTLENYWIADQMRPGAMNTDLTPDFAKYVADSFMKKIGEGLEYNIWSGNLPSAYSGATTTGYTSFDGFIKVINAGSPVTQAGFTLSETNIVSAMTLTYLKVPSRARKPELTFYVSLNTAAYYRLAVASKSNETYVAGGSRQGDTFMGYKIQESAGVPDNHIIAADPANMFVGTDLLSDANEVKLLDMSDLDGSQNIRMISRYKFGVQVGYTNEVAWFRP